MPPPSPTSRRQLAGRPLTSISGLSPTNPLYGALEKTPIDVPHHSIIGDRGKANSPKSSDGVVPYGSSHLHSAQSKLIVPGPHGSYDKPQTIKELERILELHLQSTGKVRTLGATRAPSLKEAAALSDRLKGVGSDIRRDQTELTGYYNDLNAEGYQLALLDAQKRSVNTPRP